MPNANISVTNGSSVAGFIVPESVFTDLQLDMNADQLRDHLVATMKEGLKQRWVAANDTEINAILDRVQVID